MKSRMIGGMLAGALLAGGMLLAGCGHLGHDWGCGGPGGENAEQVVHKISEELNLTADQKSALRRMEEEVRQKKADMKGEMEAVLAEVRVQILSPKVDPEKLNQIFVARQAKHDDMRKFFIGKFAEFHAMLSPEQRARLVEKIDEFHRQMQKHCDR